MSEEDNDDEDAAVEAVIGTYPDLARHLCGRWAWPPVAIAGPSATWR